MKRNGWLKREGERRRPSECHPDRLARAFGLCDPCYLRDYRAKNSARLKARAANSALIRSYGITSAQRDVMHAKQRGACAICETPPAPGKRLHVDHCHVRGAVRGLLCNLCNWYMGKVDANPAVLDRMKRYREAQ